MKKNNTIPEAIIYKDNAGSGVFSDETLVMTELGGEGHRLRYYVMISTLNNAVFTNNQKKIVKNQFAKVCKKLDSKIEEIEFSQGYALIKLLVFIEVVLQEVIDEGVNACNADEKFLRFHFYATNVKKPTKKEIQDYLNEIKRN